MGHLAKEILSEYQDRYPFQSLNELVYNILLDEIIYLYILPGERISEISVAKQLCISRTPEKNAITRLAAEGFVNDSKNRSAIVRMPTSKEINDLFLARGGIEARACAVACKIMSDEQFAVLKKKLGEIAVAQKEKNPWKIAIAEEEFHSYIVMCSKNRYLIAAYKPLIPFLRRFRILYSVFNISKYNGMVEEHSVIYNRMLQRDSHVAGSTMRVHLENILSSTDELHGERFAMAMEYAKSMRCK